MNIIREQISKLRQMSSHAEVSGKVFKELQEQMNEAANTIEKLIKRTQELEQYQAIGTVEECRKAVEKQRAESPFYTPFRSKFYYQCPSCGEILKKGKGDFCEKCGQAILWEE